MLFPKRQDYLGPFTNVTLGQIIQKEITREFLIDSIEIVAFVSVGATGGAATPNPDSLLNILKRITLNVTDGARTRNVIDCSGPGLIEYASKIRGLDLITSEAALLTAASTDNLEWRIKYPIFFGHPQMNDPERSMFVLPCNRFTTNPLLTLYFATQADIDQDASPTFVVDDITFYIVINRLQIGVDNWPIFDTELVEQVVSYPASGSNQIFELPTPGSYTGILIRGYKGVAPTQTRDWNIIVNGDYRIAVLGTNLRRAQPFMIELENEQSKDSKGFYHDPPAQAAQPFNGDSVDGGFGCLYFDFLAGDSGQGPCHADFGSLLDTNGLIKTGARAQIVGDIAGGTGVQNKYLWHRIFGDLSTLKAALKI